MTPPPTSRAEIPGTGKRVPNCDRLTVRWTIGDVRDRGFDLLRISTASAVRLFGPEAEYVVCVNSVPLNEARRLTGHLPPVVQWREVTSADVPPLLRDYSDDGLMEGMAWKLSPLRVAPDRFELAIDNDCILWDLPQAISGWLREENGAVLAEDVERYLGSFDALCPPGAYNAGIRGLCPGETLEPQLADVLREATEAQGGSMVLRSEIEEQGLQVAAVLRCRPVRLVQRSEVSICSPFWPRDPEPGACGAHFVGMNARHIPWDYFDRPADEWLTEHWKRLRPVISRLAGLE